MGDRTMSRETVNSLPRSRISSRTLNAQANQNTRFPPLIENVQDAKPHQVISLTMKPSMHIDFLGPELKVLRHYFDSHLNRTFEKLKTMIRVQFMEEIRAWYDDRGRVHPCSDEQLAEYAAADGILLLEFLRKVNTRVLPRLDEHFLVEEYVMKIENQIPMFVLQKILEWEVHADPDKDEESRIRQQEAVTKDLDNLLARAFPYLSPIQYESDRPIATVPRRDNMHLLEFVYENIIRLSDFENPNQRNGDNGIALPSAKQLEAIGVKYDCNKGLLNEIHFNGRNRTLYLPAIVMNHRTDSVLKNLLTIEGDRERETNPLICYVDLMDRLIKGANDVQSLINGHIIRNHMGSNDEVAGVWNSMGELVDRNNIKYEPIDNAVDDVIAFSRSKLQTWYNEFKQRYCSRPWIVLPLITACILLVLALLQTLLSWEQVRLQQQSMNKTADGTP